jgi:hypothetical protein
MKKDNIVNFSEKLLSAKAERDEYSRKLDAYKEGYALLIPVVEKMRKMGLTSVEIGRLFKFLGDEVFAKPPKRPK